VAARNNTGSLVSASGWAAAEHNTGSNVSASGFGAAGNNTGSNVSADGFGAALYNSGTNVSAEGYGAARDNTGSFVSASGWAAAQNNTGSNVSAGGFSSATYNTCNDVDAYGWNAGNGPVTSVDTVTINAATPTTVTASPAVTAPVGSTVIVSPGASTIANLTGVARAFVVTSPTVLTLVNPNVVLGVTGVATGSSVARYQCWSNNSYFGRFSQGTGPNQAVLGGPSQTPCGWAPFTVISDARDKFVIDSDAKGRGLDFIAGLKPTLFKIDPRERYTVTETVETEVAVEYPMDALSQGQGQGQGQSDLKPRVETRMEKVLTSNLLVLKKDGSKANAHKNFGFLAQNVIDAAAAVGLDPEDCGVRDMSKEGGSDKLLLDTDALIANLVIAVQQLSAQNSALTERLAKLEVPVKV
jgi:hypothetical protein